MTTNAARGKGVGQVMGETYLEFAPQLVNKTSFLTRYIIILTSIVFRDTNTLFLTLSSLTTQLPSGYGKSLASASLGVYRRQHDWLTVKNWWMRWSLEGNLEISQFQSYLPKLLIEWAFSLRIKPSGPSRRLRHTYPWYKPLCTGVPVLPKVSNLQVLICNLTWKLVLLG